MTDEQKQALYRKYASDNDMKMSDMTDEDKAKAESAFDKPSEAPEDNEKSLLSSLIARVDTLITSLTPKGSKATATSQFKSFGNHWYGEWTNNLKDREGEWFSAKAIKGYIHRVDVGIIPLPRLEVWHEGEAVKIGTTKMLDYIEHDGIVIVRACGEYDATPDAQKAKAFYNSTKEPQAMSHGFTYPDGALKDNVYHEFNTFELSVLPLKAAANPYTSFEYTKEKEMSEHKRAYFEQVFGKERAQELVTQAQEKASTLAEFAEYKDFTSVDALLETETNASEETNSKDLDAMKSLLNDIIGDTAEVTEAQAGMAKAIKELVAITKEQSERIEKLESELSEAPRAASQAEETETQDNELEDAAKSKEANEKSGFWSQFVTEEA